MTAEPMHTIRRQWTIATLLPIACALLCGCANAPRPAPFAHNDYQPEYRTFKGWKRPTVGILEWQDLPQEARDYIDFIEQEIEAPVTLVSTGPRREETIVRSHPDLERLTAGRLKQVLEQR